MGGGTDLQALFERNIMNAECGYVWGTDWYWSDDELDYIGITEYRLYERDCRECIEDAN